MLSLKIFQSCVVLTKKEFLNCSVLAGNCLKHWLLLQTDLSTMFFLTKSSNCFARMVRFDFLSPKIVINIAQDKDWGQLGIYPPLFGLIGYFKI